MFTTRRQLFCLIICSLITSLLAADITTTTAKPPSRRYPVRTFLGNMYHRFRNNRTPMILIPPLLRLAYQYGGPLLERMGSALGLGTSAAASGPIDGIVESALSGALGQAAGGGAAAAAPLSPFAGLPPGIGGFGAAPMGFGGLAGGGVRPVFFRRR